MSDEKYRVEDKQNVHFNGRRTKFALFKRDGDVYVHLGQFTAMGWNQTDAKCISAALDTIDRIESET